MNQTPERSATYEFTFDPTNKIIGIIDDPAAAKIAVRDLRAAGFAADEIEVVMGKKGAERVDLTGEGHEASIHVVNTEKPPAFYDAPVIIKKVEEEMLAGHYLIGVSAKEQEARERALDILKSHDGHFINFYGRWAAESWEP
ncbi:MAG TPA: hypothetical protein VJV03_03190 [Pyrinomonadaceae bacterium]|nr:hypothetical protein [Pyrinomonadaceae bacterium]